MTKEEKIKEAWGELMPDYTNIDLNSGWSLDDFYDEYFNDINFDTMQIYEPCKIRPKSLQGIENNNGWIKIESEDVLPKIGEYDMSSFTLYYWTNNGLYQSEDYKRWKLHHDHLQITHYRLEPILNPKPPIY